MNVTRGEQYDERAIAFQSVQVKLLDDALLEAGVSDAEVRERAVGNYLFAFGNLLDQYWIEVEAEAAHVFPCIGFSKTYLGGPDGPVTDPGGLLVGFERFAWHEMVFGAVDWHYRDGGEPADYGVVSDAERNRSSGTGG